MALSTKTMRGLTRYLPGAHRDNGAATPRLVVFPQDVTPVYEPIYIRPTEVPSGTLAAGSLWFDDDNNTLAWYNGTTNVEALHTAGDQSITGDLTIGDDLTLNSNAAVITVGVTGPVTITHGTNLLTLGTGDKLVADIIGAGVETGGGAATLTAAQSGGVFAFNNATGFLYTLPAAVAGLRFTFVVETTCTSGVHRVACASGDFLLGTILQGSDGTFTLVARDADGSTHLAWEGNGSTTGGIKGDFFEVVAISATQWRVWGINTATGTEATPFKTS